MPPNSALMPVGSLAALRMQRGKTRKLGAMKATVQARNADGGCSVRTENNILLVFALKGSEFLAVGDTVEVDLPSVLSTQQIVRVKDNHTIGIQLNPNDIHDLDVPAKHGTSRTPSPERMHGTYSALLTDAVSLLRRACGAGTRER